MCFLLPHLHAAIILHPLQSGAPRRQWGTLQPPPRHPLLNTRVLDGMRSIMNFKHDPRAELRIQPVLSAAALDEPVQFGLFARAVQASSGDSSSSGSSSSSSSSSSRSHASETAERTIVFHNGEQVCMYGGILVHSQELKNHGVPHTHACRVRATDFVMDGLPFAQMLIRPVPGTLSRLSELLAAGVQPLLPSPALFTPAELDRFYSSPLGFMCNTAEPARVNVKIMTLSVNPKFRWEVPRLVATRDIYEGEELLVHYNTAEGRALRSAEPLENAKIVAAACAAAAAAPNAGLVSGTSPAAVFGRFNLLEGNPSHRICLQRQSENLSKFVADNKSAFDKLIFEAFTTGQTSLPSGTKRAGIGLETRCSQLLPSMLGVYLRAPLPAARRSELKSSVNPCVAVACIV